MSPRPITPITTHQQPPSNDGVLIVGNYCHDVLIENNTVKAESLGGAASFISIVLNGMSIPCTLVSKVGPDFIYEVNHDPISIPTSKTTVFHAYFGSGLHGGNAHQDRALKRVCACDPINPDDLPDGRFRFGMAVGVGGEILPETLERMIEICDVVFVDIQALIREFDEIDGCVKLVRLEDTGFYPLLPRVGVLKTSSEEAAFMDMEMVRKWCCVVVTNGKEGCRVNWRDGDVKIMPFLANQEDPTGAGDSFLGGFVAGLVQGLVVPDAAMLGNFFGSVTVEYVGLPRFNPKMMQRVKDEVRKRKIQRLHCNPDDGALKYAMQAEHEQFHSCLLASKLACTSCTQECNWNQPNSTTAIAQGLNSYYDEHLNSFVNNLHGTR